MQGMQGRLERRCGGGGARCAALATATTHGAAAAAWVSRAGSGAHAWLHACSSPHPPALPPLRRPKTNECILSAPLPQLADRCSADPLCAAFIWKPAGTFSTNATNVGTLRQAQGANATRMVSNPTAVVYFKEQASSTSPQPSSGSSGGLSSGAIAGIAAGCAVTAAAAGGWALLLWRRRQRAAHVAAVAPAGSDKALEDGKCSGLAPPFLALACKGAGQAEGSSHRGVLGEAPAAQAATCKDPTGGHGQDSSSSGGTKNGGVGSAAASPVPLKAAIIGWRTAASPFAAARGRMGPSPSAASPGGSGSGPAGCTGPAASGGRLTPISPLDSSGEHMLSNSGTSGEDAAPVEEPEQQVELSRVIKELIQHREAEEAAACLPTGATQPAGGAGSGSGGGGFGSGGSGGSGFGAAPSHLGPAALPPSLQACVGGCMSGSPCGRAGTAAAVVGAQPHEPPPSLSPPVAPHRHHTWQAWLIPPGELKYLERRNGELAVLGEGARWASGAVRLACVTTGAPGACSSRLPCPHSARRHTVLPPLNGHPAVAASSAPSCGARWWRPRR